MMTIYNKVREVPAEAQKPITAGRLKGYTDINPQWRIQMLTEMFGPCGIGWTYKVVDRWSEQVGNEVCAFVGIEMQIKVDGEWSAPIPGSGGSKLATMEKNGQYVSDECYKMATTDAISVACKQLGFGADIYWANGRSKYNQVNEEEKTETEPVKKQEPEQLAIASRKATREEMLELIAKKYPAGPTLDKLLKHFGVDSLDKLNISQIIATYNRCQK